MLEILLAAQRQMETFTQREIATAEATSFMEEARMVAAQCWCDEETQDRIMDPALAEAMAKRIAAWMDTAAQCQRNTDYYRGLLERCGKSIGDRAFIADDGTRMDDVLCAKIPEIIETDYVHGGG